MYLAPQQGRRPDTSAGFAMAALLVSISVMGLMLSMALPVWSHAAKREREAELIFRGEQYARAVALYQRKLPGAFPPDLDTLVEQRFLRRKYADPMTEDGEFQVILQAQMAGAPGAGAATATRPGEAVDVDQDLPLADGRAGSDGLDAPSGVSGGGAPGGFGRLGAGGDATPGGVAGGIVGVVSKSDATSIAEYNGRTKYNEWAFIYSESTGQPGVGLPGGVPEGIQPDEGLGGMGDPFGLQPGGGLGSERGLGAPGSGPGSGAGAGPRRR